MHTVPVTLKIQVASRGVLHVIKRPTYLALAIVMSFLFVEFIFWINNLPLLQYILTVPTLSLATKADFLLSTYGNLWQSSSSPLAAGLLALSIIQGVTLSVLIFIFRHQKTDRSAVTAIGGSSIASMFAVLGLGCAACGTSLITPILVFLFSSSSAALADTVGLGVAFIGLLAGVYALYTVGLRSAAFSS